MQPVNRQPFFLIRSGSSDDSTTPLSISRSDSLDDTFTILDSESNLEEQGLLSVTTTTSSGEDSVAVSTTTSTSCAYIPELPAELWYMIMGYFDEDCFESEESLNALLNMRSVCRLFKDLVDTLPGLLFRIHYDMVLREVLNQNRDQFRTRFNNFKHGTVQSLIDKLMYDIFSLPHINNSFIDLVARFNINYDQRNKNGDSYLHIAIRSNAQWAIQSIFSKIGHSAICGLFKDTNKLGNTPLHIALMNGYLEIARYSLEIIANIPELTNIAQIANRMGNTLLHMAVRTRSLDWVQFIFDLNPSALTALNEGLKTPICEAIDDDELIDSGNISIIQFLCSHVTDMSLLKHCILEVNKSIERYEQAIDLVPDNIDFGILHEMNNDVRIRNDIIDILKQQFKIVIELILHQAIQDFDIHAVAVLCHEITDTDFIGRFLLEVNNDLQALEEAKERLTDPEQLEAIDLDIRIKKQILIVLDNRLRELE